MGIFLLVLILASCYENEDGCLDIQATNYDVSADIPCDGCCKYPTLKLKLYQSNDTLSLKLGDTITNNLGHQVRLLKYVYFVSNVAVTIDEKQYYVNDSLAFWDGSDTTWVKNDIFRVRRSTPTYTIGDFRTSGAITNISFDIGIPASVEGKEILTTTDNALYTDSDSLRQSDYTYIIQRLQVATGDNLQDTSIVDVPALFGPRSVSISIDTASIQGKDKVIDLKVDYRHWFDDIDFTSNTQSEISKRLMDNLSESFSDR